MEFVTLVLVSPSDGLLILLVDVIADEFATALGALLDTALQRKQNKKKIGKNFISMGRISAEVQNNL